MKYYFVAFLYVPYGNPRAHGVVFGNELINEHPFDWLMRRREPNGERTDDYVLLSWQEVDEATYNSHGTYFDATAHVST